MATLTELTNILLEVRTTLEKARTEIITKIDELENALQNVQLPVEAERVLSEVRAAAAALDAIVPDVPTE